MAELPKFTRIRQTFDRTTCDDIPGTIRAELAGLGLDVAGKTWAANPGHWNWKLY
jgi:hypothetical protein